MTRVRASGATHTTFGSSGVRWVPICDGAGGCIEDDTDRGFAVATLATIASVTKRDTHAAFIMTSILQNTKITL